MQMNLLMSGRGGKSYAEELRQQYDVAARQQKVQLPRQQQQQQQPAGVSVRDDDVQSITTTSTATTLGGGLCWRCCYGGRVMGSEDPRVTPMV